MTMLFSFYTAEGIVFGSDSQITRPSPSGNDRGDPQTKVLDVPRLGIAGGGVIGFYGLAQVNGAPMDDWLRAQIGAWASSATVGDFVEHIRSAIERDATTPERRTVSGFHVGGFERREGVVVPVFWFLRNTHDFDENMGLHSNVKHYHADEQLLKHYMAGMSVADVRRELRSRQQRGLPFWLRNGDLPFFAAVWNGIEEALNGIVKRPGFRTPTTIDGWETIARTFVRTTSDVYRSLCTAGAPTIGGKPIVCSVVWPP